MERALERLWNSLPRRNSGAADDVVKGYLYALRGLSLDAAEAVFSRLIDGTQEDWRKPYCPLAPELARMVRNEAAARRPKQALPAPTRYGGPAPFEIRQERLRAQYEGMTPLATGVHHTQFAKLCQQKAFPPGAFLVAALGNVYGPEVA